ncbi:MAG: DUF2085 domain-containing protein [Candidatus Dojkabacteria bacterium]
MFKNLSLKTKNFFKDFYNIYLTVLGTLATLPVLAPILLKIGLTGPAKTIYFIYSFFCHQFASRSIDIFDYQYAWCARDTGIWLGIFTTAFLVKYNKLSKLKWYWVAPFVVPIALDGGLQTIFTFLNISPLGDLTGMPMYVSNNFSRFITGAIFGIGIGWWISQQLKFASEELYEKREQRKEKIEKRNNLKSYIVQTLILIFSLGISYLGLVAIWNITSVQNKPLDFLDSAVKTPAKDFFARRGDGICPTSGINDVLDLGCFFGNK